MRRLLVSLLLLVVATPSASAKTLPKGTPYAAEVSAVITGTVKLSQDYDTVAQSVCEAQPAHVAQHEQFELHWKATYPHVTVPVAGFAQLGKAYKRLHVPVQPTSNGTGGLQGGGYEIDGTAPSRGDTCDAVRFAGSGQLQTSPYDPMVGEKNALVDDMAGGSKPRTLIGFLLGTVDSATPATVDTKGAGTNGDVAGFFRGLEDTFPTPTVDSLSNPAPEDNRLTLDLPFEQFRPLLHHTSLKFPLSDAGSVDCSRDDPGIATTVCTSKYDYDYTVVLHRKLLYKTLRAYPR